MVRPLGFDVEKLIDIDFRDNNIYIVRVSGRRLCLLSDIFESFYSFNYVKSLDFCKMSSLILICLSFRILVFSALLISYEPLL